MEFIGARRVGRFTILWTNRHRIRNSTKSNCWSVVCTDTHGPSLLQFTWNLFSKFVVFIRSANHNAIAKMNEIIIIELNVSRIVDSMASLPFVPINFCAKVYVFYAMKLKDIRLLMPTIKYSSRTNTYYGGTGDNGIDKWEGGRDVIEHRRNMWTSTEHNTFLYFYCHACLENDIKYPITLIQHSPTSSSSHRHSRSSFESEPCALVNKCYTNHSSIQTNIFISHNKIFRIGMCAFLPTHPITPFAPLLSNSMSVSTKQHHHQPTYE